MKRGISHSTWVALEYGTQKRLDAFFSTAASGEE